MTALIPSHTENKDLRLLGARISSSQSDEINFMKRWLASARRSRSPWPCRECRIWNKSGKPMALMPGMLTPEQMEALREGQGRRIRPSIFSRHDSAPQRRADNGEGSIQYRGCRAGSRHIQLRDGCGQHATRRDKDYAVHAGEKIARGETMNSSAACRFPSAVAALFCCCGASRIHAQAPATAPPRRAAKPAPEPREGSG